MDGNGNDRNIGKGSDIQLCFRMKVLPHDIVKCSEEGAIVSS